MKGFAGRLRFRWRGRGVRPTGTRPPFPFGGTAPRTPLSTSFGRKDTVHADAIERLDEIRKKVQELRGYL